MREFHLTNEDGKDTAVHFSATIVNAPPRLGHGGVPADFVRYLSATEETSHAHLTEQHGEDYSAALVEGDPEIDVERVGMRLGESRRVFIEGGETSTGERIRHAPPLFIEVLYNADGSERERREPQEVPANINEELPVYWTGKKIPRADAARQFVMTRTVQIFHRDGLTYDYLFSIAQDLHKEGKVVLLGAGSKGKEPLVFQSNGTPYRGFLEGRIEGQSYKLLLHLSNMELKQAG